MCARRWPPRIVRTAVQGTLILAGVLAAANLDAWAACPSPDPSADYNCPLGPTYVLPGWTNAAGWTQPSQYQTIQLGDLDGDGKAELIGRDPSGLSAHAFNTTRGVWEPIVRADGNGLLLLALSDAAGWEPPQYSITIQLADVDGQPGRELVARSAAGLLVFKFVKGALPGSSFQPGSWQQLNTTGPFADTSTFSNGKNWGSDVGYYSTIQLADIDGQPGAEAIGWGGDGLVVAKWTGTGWTALTGIPALGDAVAQGESTYLPLQLADLDGQPGAELLLRQSLGPLEGGGLHVWKYQSGGSGGAWSKIVGSGPFDTDDCPGRDCYATIQTADLNGDGVTEVVGRLSSGTVAVYRLIMPTPTSGQWTPVGAAPLLTGVEWLHPAQYETIQLADIDGQPGAELLAKDVPGPEPQSGGIVVYTWDATARTFTGLVSGIPALAADPWSTDRSYWATVQTGDVDGDREGRAAGPRPLRHAHLAVPGRPAHLEPLPAGGRVSAVHRDGGGGLYCPQSVPGHPDRDRA
jgi:hypothetical protein